VATIAGLPINGVNGQFALIKDPIQAFNDTARFVDITRGVPIVDFLANSAQQAALGQNNRSFLASTLLPNPLLQQQDVSRLAAASQLAPQNFNLAAPTLTQGLQPSNAQQILGQNAGLPQQPTAGIANQPIQLDGLKKLEFKQNGDIKIEYQKQYSGPPGLARFGGIPPGQLKKMSDDDDDDGPGKSKGPGGPGKKDDDDDGPGKSKGPGKGGRGRG
jgi:hypothetical protein